MILRGGGGVRCLYMPQFFSINFRQARKVFFKVHFHEIAKLKKKGVPPISMGNPFAAATLKTSVVRTGALSDSAARPVATTKRPPMDLHKLAQRRAGNSEKGPPPKDCKPRDVPCFFSSFVPFYEFFARDVGKNLCKIG